MVAAAGPPRGIIGQGLGAVLAQESQQLLYLLVLLNSGAVVIDQQPHLHAGLGLGRQLAGQGPADIVSLQLVDLYVYGALRRVQGRLGRRQHVAVYEEIYFIKPRAARAGNRVYIKAEPGPVAGHCGGLVLFGQFLDSTGIGDRAVQLEPPDMVVQIVERGRVRRRLEKAVNGVLDILLAGIPAVPAIHGRARIFHQGLEHGQALLRRGGGHIGGAQGGYLGNRIGIDYRREGRNEDRRQGRGLAGQRRLRGQLFEGLLGGRLLLQQRDKDEDQGSGRKGILLIYHSSIVPLYRQRPIEAKGPG